jgi:hypothetical protein
MAYDQVLLLTQVSLAERVASQRLQILMQCVT